ncbi:MAG: nicotinate-nucleotide--dimethylbenzimidazole phosphoribosyltransferase [Rhodospirillales bacterium]|nr:nicotinate-nucleotide--dimethylbenzimidazole phosphoribosyltransferase [Rhodospirillales bacterium]
MTISSLDDLRAQLRQLPGPDNQALEKANAREPQLTKPPGSLGRLEQLAAWLSAWQGTHPPRMERPRARVFAGNHGVVGKGVSAYPSEVTQQMVYGFEAGTAAINQLCKTFDIELQVVALDLDRPTADFTQAAALTEAEFVDAFNAGMDAVPAETDLICLGEMGIGNTTSAAAICHALYGGHAADWTGAGTGVAGAAMDIKIAVVGDGVTRHQAAIHDGIDALRHLGGRELVAIAGAIVAARQNRVPVMIDGFISSAAAAALEASQPGALDHCQIAHASAEKGHRQLLEVLNKQPLLDLGMRLGEGSGAALAVGLVRAAVDCHRGMATFAEAGVSDKED